LPICSVAARVSPQATASAITCICMRVTSSTKSLLMAAALSSFEIGPRISAGSLQLSPVSRSRNRLQVVVEAGAVVLAELAILQQCTELAADEIVDAYLGAA